MRSPVIVVGWVAFKFARDSRGRASNLYEAELYRSKPLTDTMNTRPLYGLR
jgi:hypothetical protein